MNQAKYQLVLTAVVLVATLVSAPAAGLADELAADADADAPATRLTTYGQVFSSYDRSYSDAGDFNAFRLDRAQLDVGFGWQDWAGAYLSVEGVRSAGPDSLFGVDENSIVARVKYGFGYIDPELGPGVLQVRGGLIPDLWIESVEAGYDLRGLSPLAAEKSGFFDTSDLGASVTYSAWQGLAALRVSMTNGEGRNQVELNEGKNTTFVLDVRPVAVDFWGGEGVLGLHAGWRDGSQGVGQLRAHRGMGAITFRHPRLGAGVEYERALGYLGRGDRVAQSVGAWANAALWHHWLNIFGRYDRVDTDVDADDATIDTIQAGLFGDAFAVSRAPEARRLRLYVGYRHRSFGANAAPVPGVPEAADADVVFATVEARGLIVTTSSETSP